MYRILPCVNAELWANTSVGIELGVMIEQHTWCAQHDFPGGHFDFDTIKISVTVDQEPSTLINGHTDIKIRDGQNLTHHTLCLTIQGLDHSHHKFIENIGDCAVMTKLTKLTIENVCIKSALEKLAHGLDIDQHIFVPSEFLGVNGAWHLEFYTPIYQWLLDNQSNLC